MIILKNGGYMIKGGENLERLYLYDFYDINSNTKYSKTDISISGIDIKDVIARHIGRYGLILPFIRPNFKILDFPCGSGIFIELLSILVDKHKIPLSYDGRDIDAETIIYAKEIYEKDNTDWIHFERGDLTNFKLRSQYYDTICCIEGIEHIDQFSQKNAIAEFANGLKDDGTFIMTSPESDNSNNSKSSGPNIDNKYHLWELTKDDLLELLRPHFKDIEIISQKNLLTTGHVSTCHYAIVRKGGISNK